MYQRARLGYLPKSLCFSQTLCEDNIRVVLENRRLSREEQKRIVSQLWLSLFEECHQLGVQLGANAAALRSLGLALNPSFLLGRAFAGLIPLQLAKFRRQARLPAQPRHSYYGSQCTGNAAYNRSGLYHAFGRHFSLHYRGSAQTSWLASTI